MKRSKKTDELCIGLDEIGDSGYHLSCRKSKSFVTDSLHELKNIDCSFEEDVGIELDFFKTGTTVLIRGGIATTMQLRCVRCLEGFTLPLAATFNYNLCPEKEGDLPAEMEIPKEAFDAYYYSGTVIDLTPLIVEQIVLHIPAYPLCQDSCKGICQGCGADLNRAPCHCGKEEGAVSPFAALKDFSPRQKT